MNFNFEGRRWRRSKLKFGGLDECRKNLRYDLSEFKRVHIEKHFVLTFKVSIRDNFILFVDFDHHDNIYKRK
ncbi:MAG: hypothetical protein KJ858_03910 [Nanoarchaeota archaeon]|nr:hypothetical protein [Nanoarchaeota archaeon]